MKRAKFFKFTLILLLIFVWVFGYPPIYENFWRASTAKILIL